MILKRIIYSDVKCWSDDSNLSSFSGNSYSRSWPWRDSLSYVNTSVNWTSRWVYSGCWRKHI